MNDQPSDIGTEDGLSDRAVSWQVLLLRLGDRLRGLNDETEIANIASSVLGRYLELERVGLAQLVDEHHCEIMGEWRLNENQPAFMGRYDLAEFGQEVVHHLIAGQNLVWPDALEAVEQQPGDLADKYKALGIGAMLNIPVVRHGKSQALIYAHQAHSRNWSLEQILLVQEIVESTWSNIERVRSESALQEANARLHLALEAGGLAAWDWNLTTGTLVWSDEHFRIFGYEPGDVRPTFELWQAAIHPEDLSGALDAVEQGKVDGLFNAVYRILRPDGELRWCMGRGRFLFSGSNQPVRMIGVLEDVTARKQAELELRQSEERFRLIVENATGYAIFTTDSQGRIESWPQGARAIFGWSAEDIIGKSADILFVPEDRAADAPQLEFDTALREGYAPDVRWHQRQDGRRVFIDGGVWPLRGADQELRGFLKVGQDVSQRRHDEIALRASEERFRVLATAVPHLVFRSTPKGERTWASPRWAEYTGMTEEESRGLGWLKAIHPEDRHGALQKWTDAEGGEAYYGEHRIRRQADGMYRWHQSRAVPLPADAGSPDEWVGSAADIHDMRLMQDRFSVLIAELQHRTRNLLGIVRGILAQTITDSSMAPFREAFSERLNALSRVQGFLSRTDGKPVSIHELLTLELEAVGVNWAQVTLSGGSTELSDLNLQTLALAIHELTTNAFKHGALAEEGGRLIVDWKTEQDGSGPVLTIRWVEVFAQPKELPESHSTGFGRQLIEEALPYQLGAETDFRLGLHGFRCTVRMPLHRE